MYSLKGEKVYLRALEPSDLDFLYYLENSTEVWEVSGTTAPYSKQVLEMYLDNVHRDIYEVKQLRLCICALDDTVVGLIDLFDFDPKNRKAGIGVIIASKDQRNNGFGAEALELLCGYSRVTLELHQVYCNILEDNHPSIHLFEKLGFKKIGIKKDWILSEGIYKNEILYQKIFN
ncbi:GNAT family N-acetyltransferase [Cellulophaga sp. HaHa_2_95]|uniref:GNAT family N-acetyltransferase n=1 Tax=unclassified Cellulophaga TaxID=2634405 RepID=UPI001C4F3D58|nr:MULTISPECIES: GNAT family N-acetyltransferase [unclassified Cellulophaga]QXP53472.1 GNAT family N-acetyltransferase [Cellulophaga sp. HaHa_2_1]QXP57920.1 GNAT family N-acetyltransferase [Cellulophaga sp. HaHa_2_95]